MYTEATRFSGEADRAFVAELRAAVNNYFAENKLSTRANRAMWGKAAFMLALVFGSYALLLSGVLPLWGMWLCCAVLGAGIAGYGFSVMHDAMHGTFSENPRVNAALGFVLDLVGASSYLWDLRHNKMHHAYTNIYGADVDLDASWVLRLSPHAERHSFHRYQWFYAYFAYSISSIQWIVAKDYKSLSLRSHGPFRDVTHTPGQIALVIGMKLLHYFNFIVLPLLVLDVTLAQFLVGFVTLHVSTGLIMTLTFQLSHCVDVTEQFASDPGETLGHSWVVHELKVTSNFACNNRLLTWYIGGLNHQIEHHLFPNICSVHYPAIRPIVKAIAARHGMPYHEQPTLGAALAAHHRLLVQLGAAPQPQAVRLRPAGGL